MSMTEENKPSARRQRQLDRMKKVRDAAQTPRVRVVPRDDSVRSLIKHPRGGGFLSSGSVEWPDDTFTRRRIADGTVTIEAQSAPSSQQQVQQSADAS